MPKKVMKGFWHLHKVLRVILPVHPWGVGKPHRHLLSRLLMAISFRTLNGLGILVCSMDGSVAFLDFSQDELGDPLSEEEKVREHYTFS